MHLAQLCGNVLALCGDCVGWVNLSLGSIIKGQLESDKKKASTILKIPVIQNFHRLHSPISAEAFSVDQFPFFMSKLGRGHRLTPSHNPTADSR
jgi:hypothetical protein